MKDAMNKPEIEVVRIDSCDILTASKDSDNDHGRV